LAQRFLSEVVLRQIREGFLSLLLRSGADLMPKGVMSLHFSGGIFTKLMCPQDMSGNFSEYFMCRVMHEEKVFQKEGPTSGGLRFWECLALKVLLFKKIDHQIKLYGWPRCAAHYCGLFCLYTGFSDGVANGPSTYTSAILGRLEAAWMMKSFHHFHLSFIRIENSHYIYDKFQLVAKNIEGFWFFSTFIFSM